MQRLKRGGPTPVVMTPLNHLVVPRDMHVEVLPTNWRQVLERIRKTACKTCCPANPADPSRRIGCNQTDKKTWKCNYCHCNNLPCSWAAGKLLRQNKKVCIMTNNNTAAAKKALGNEPPMHAPRAIQENVSNHASANDMASQGGGIQQTTTSSSPSWARPARDQSGGDTNEVCD